MVQIGCDTQKRLIKKGINMALQKTYTFKSISLPDAYHEIKEVIISEDYSTIVIYLFKDSGSSSNSENLVTELLFTVSGADNTTYFLTVHATDNILKRAETYLIDKIAEYSGGIVVA